MLINWMCFLFIFLVHYFDFQMTEILLLDFQNYIEALGVEGTYLIQCWSLFLCEMLVVISRDKKSIPPCDELLSCISGQKYLTNKCITIIKEIIQNKWFEGM